MKNHKTKYFGEIEIDLRNSNGFSVQYKGQGINICFVCSDYNENTYSDWCKKIINILDNYDKVNRTAKNAIIENYCKDVELKCFFNCFFELLDEEDVTETTENMRNEAIIFFISEEKGFTFTLSYLLSEYDSKFKAKKEHENALLSVNMNEAFSFSFECSKEL